MSIIVTDSALHLVIISTHGLSVVEFATIKTADVCSPAGWPSLSPGREGETGKALVVGEWRMRRAVGCHGRVVSPHLTDMGMRAVPAATLVGGEGRRGSPKAGGTMTPPGERKPVAVVTLVVEVWWGRQVVVQIWVVYLLPIYAHFEFLTVLTDSLEQFDCPEMVEQRPLVSAVWDIAGFIDFACACLQFRIRIDS